ncbi:MAG: NAD(P)H-dependent oxidoreductase [Pseudonocardia sp.]|nr:NAD(P)H-dependent oxidoreductase [Pseudonocardia sp.]
MHLLLLSGSTRSGSVNTAVLRTAAVAAGPRVTTDLFDGLVGLPAFDPDRDVDPLPGPVAGLRARIGAADALLICTPEYAGGMPGAFKNLLDWTVGGMEIHGRPVAWVNAASVAAPTGASGTHAGLAAFLGYVGAAVADAACARVPLGRADIDDDGLVADPAAREAIGVAVRALCEAAIPSEAGDR